MPGHALRAAGRYVARRGPADRRSSRATAATELPERPEMSTPFWGPDFDALAGSDPEIAGVVAGRAGPAARRPAADRQRELHQPGGAGRARQHAVEQVRRGLSRHGATTAAARSSTGPRRSASPGPRSCSAPSTPTCSRTPAPAPTSRRTARSCSPATPCSAMSLPHGGHLTHGTKVSFSGKWFNAVHYGVRAGHRAHRLRPGARPGPRAPAEDDHLRRHRRSRG